MAQESEEEQPLDPELELVRRKMLRLLIVSIGIMGIGLFAVLGAIIYKLGSSTTGVVGDPGSEYSLELPQGSRVTDSHVAQDRLVLNVENTDGSSLFVIIDTGTGKEIRRIRTR